MKYTATRLTFFLLIAIAIPANAQTSIATDQCLGLKNDLTSNKQDKQQYVQDQLTLLQSDLSTDQKASCLATRGKTALLGQSSADEPLSTILYEDWENEAWVSDFLDEYFYRPDGSISNIIESNWNDATASFDPVYNFIVTFDANGNLATTHELMWDEATSSFVNYSMQTFEISESNQFLGAQNYSWENNDWVLDFSFSTTVVDGLITEDLTQALNDAGVLEDVSRSFFEYDDQNRVISEIFESWDADMSVWETVFRELTSYGDLTSTSTTEFSIGNDMWLAASEEVTTYNDQGLATEIVVSSLITGAPVPSGRTVNTYNEMGLLTNRLGQTPDDMGMWENSSQTIITLDGDGDILEDLLQFYATGKTGQAWENISRDVFTYAPAAVSVEDDIKRSLSSLDLYPSPATNRVNLELTLEQPTALVVDVFDVLGRRVTTLADSPAATGPQQIVWNPQDAPAGLYFVRFQLDNTVETRSVVLMP